MPPSSRPSTRSSLAVSLLLLVAAPAAAGLFSGPCGDLDALSPLQADTDAQKLAVGCLKKSLPDDRRARVLARLARIRAALGDSEQAGKDLESALALRPEDPALLRAVAESRRERGQDGLELARKAGAHRLAGEILADRGDAAGAATEFAAALKASPDDLEALRGLVHVSSGAQAAGYAARAAEAAARSPAWSRGAALRFAAQILLDAGDRSEAAKALAAALALDPDDIEALQTLVLIHRRDPSLALPAMPSQDAPMPPPAAGPGRDAAERFASSAVEAPAWQRYDALSQSVLLSLAAGERRKAEKTYDALENRDYQTLQTYRLHVALYGGETRGGGELSRLRENVDLRLRLGDHAGAAAAAARAHARYPWGWEPLRELARVKVEEGCPAQALGYAKQLLEAYEKTPIEVTVAEFGNNIVFEHPGRSDQVNVQRSLKENPELVARAKEAQDRQQREAKKIVEKLQSVVDGASGIHPDKDAPAPELAIDQRDDFDVKRIVERQAANRTGCPAVQPKSGLR